MLIFLIGYMGCGKSTIGRPLARRLGYRFVDMDVEVERCAGMSIADLFVEQGEERFRLLEQTILQQLPSEQDAVVATGGGAPCFFDNMEVMNRLGLTIYLKVTPEKLAQRLEPGQAKRPLIRDKSPEELLAFIRQSLIVREPFYSQAKLIAACDSMSDEYIAQHIFMYFQNYQSDL